MFRLPGSVSWPCTPSQTVERIEPRMVFSRHVPFLFIYFPPYFFRVDVLILLSSYPLAMLKYPVSQHRTGITRMVFIALVNKPETHIHI